MDAQAKHRWLSFGRFLTRKTVYPLFLLCYSAPLALALKWRGEWMLGVALVGGGALFWLLRAWEHKMQSAVGRLVQARMGGIPVGAETEEAAQLRAHHEEREHHYQHEITRLGSLARKAQERVEELNFEMDQKLDEVRQAYLEYEDMRKDYDRLQDEFLRFQHETHEELKHKDSLLSEYQHTIAEQRMILEKKQRYVAKLEGKVRDLMYEIRSLLQLEEPPSAPAAPPFLDPNPSEEDLARYYLPQERSDRVTNYDLSMHLQRYIELAQNFTGADHLGYVGGQSPRFLDPSTGSYAIDQRRLFDTFRDETVGAVFIFSPMEEKFLFINNTVKRLLGWSPEKFLKDFPSLIERGSAEWAQAIHQIASVREQKLQLVIRTKQGDEKPFQCLLGVVPGGPFSGNVLGILSPAE